MDNLVSETNTRLESVINDLTTIKEEYENNLEKNNKEINEELERVRKYKAEFSESKEKIAKMNDDIHEFEEDYQHLVTRFKDDELANILIAANKEISQKIDERKAKIISDKKAMNELVLKAEKVKKKLVRLTAEKKGYQECLTKINDAFYFYTAALNSIINYAKENEGKLTSKHFNITEEEVVETKLEDVALSDINSITSENETLNTGLGNQTTLIDINEMKKPVIESNIEDNDFIFNDADFDMLNDLYNGNINRYVENDTNEEETKETTTDVEEIDIENDPEFNFEFEEEIVDSENTPTEQEEVTQTEEETTEEKFEESEVKVEEEEIKEDTTLETEEIKDEEESNEVRLISTIDDTNEDNNGVIGSLNNDSNDIVIDDNIFMTSGIDDEIEDEEQ